VAWVNLDRSGRRGRGIGRTRRGVRATGMAVALALLAGLCFVVARETGLFFSSSGGSSANQWAQQASTNTLVTDPTADLTSGQIAFLRQAAARTWSFLSGPDLDPATHLPLDSVDLAGQPGTTVQLAAPTAKVEYTNPSLIGTYLDAIVAARDLGLVSASQAQTDAGATLAEIQQMVKYDGFLFRWYSTATGDAIATPQGETDPYGYVSTVDEGWFAQGLLVCEKAFPALSAQVGALLGAMQWSLLYDQSADALYNGYQTGGGYSNSTYTNSYSGPRIAEYMAIGSGQVPGALWWGLNRTPPPSRPQQQTPQGQDETYTDPQNNRQYTEFEGHYVYDEIKFVPTLDGSLYQALAPDLVFPEQTMAPLSLGLNDRNSALAMGAYGALTGTPVWGWAPTTKPGSTMRYDNFGAPGLAIQQTGVDDAVASPYAAAMALPVIPTQAYADLSQMVTDYPDLYTQYGFLDSVDLANDKIADRFMTVSQLTILMAIDNAVDRDGLQSYVTGTSYANELAPYMSMEQYSIQGLDTTASPSSAAQPTSTAKKRRSDSRSRRDRSSAAAA
jgi:hypothetical protein